MADDPTPDDTDYDAQQRQNIIVLLFVALLLGACVWTVNWLMTSAKIEQCLEAHHRNCEEVPSL